MRHLNKKIVAVIDGKRVRMTFSDIQRIADSRGIPKRYAVGDGKLHDTSLDRFAERFTSRAYPNYRKVTFKVTFDWFGTTFWEVGSLDKKKMFELTSPCQIF